jgi:hypothetical protein
MAGLHAQELHEADYVTRVPAGPRRFALPRAGSVWAMRPAEAQGPPPSLFEVVHRAVEVTDPSGEFGVGDLLQYVEDNDEPVTAHADIEEELAEIKGRVDPQDEDPAVMMAIAVATYLAFRRDEINDNPGDILRLAARAEFDGHPPDNVRAWLDEQGVAV